MDVKLIAPLMAIVFAFSPPSLAEDAKPNANANAATLEKAQSGDVTAQIELGDSFMKGTGARQSWADAALWYRKAAEQGNTDAQFKLASMPGFKSSTMTIAERMGWYLKAAEGGHLLAQQAMGSAFEDGRGVEKSASKAIYWYTQSAVQGDSRSQFSLGRIYRFGQGVEPDLRLAATWYRKAAEQGHSLSQLALANMYAKGQGVPQSNSKAEAWFIKAAADGYEYAQRQLEAFRLQISKHSTEARLFGQSLLATNRAEMRRAVKKAGGIVIREDLKKWSDVYRSDSLLKGSSKLTIEYTTKDDGISFVQYTFPGWMDRELVTEVKNIVVSKYGKPHRSSGRAALGNVSYDWTLKDGIKVQVTRGWPDTTTYLTFVHPENNAAIKAEQRRQKEQAEAKAYEVQNNAF